MLLSSFVLISTYWNVNCGDSVIRVTSVKVLISTYWNVNLSKTSSVYVKLGCFNLNLLECKYFHLMIPSLSAEVLISTYWNVN